MSPPIAGGRPPKSKQTIEDRGRNAARIFSLFPTRPQRRVLHFSAKEAPMLTSILTSLISNVVLGWLWRRLQELLSVGIALASFYAAMPPDAQAAISAILTGRGGGLTVTAAVGLLWYLWTQFQSWRATTRPQIVTDDKTKINLPTITKEEALAIAKAQTGYDHEYLGEP